MGITAKRGPEDKPLVCLCLQTRGSTLVGLLLLFSLCLCLCIHLHICPSLCLCLGFHLSRCSIARLGTGGEPPEHLRLLLLQLLLLLSVLLLPLLLL